MEPPGRPENLEGLVNLDLQGTQALLDTKVTLEWRELREVQDYRDQEESQASLECLAPRVRWVRQGSRERMERKEVRDPSVHQAYLDYPDHEGRVERLEARVLWGLKDYLVKEVRLV